MKIKTAGKYSPQCTNHRDHHYHHYYRRIVEITVSLRRSESKKNGENNTQIIKAACTLPSNSNLSQTLKKGKYLKVT